MREYAGPVYDGPWEGRRYTDQRDYFWIALYPRMSVHDFCNERNAGARRAIYRWSYPLRAWVFDWQSTRNLP